MTKQLVDSFEGAHHQLETTPWDDVSNAPCGTCSGACGVALLLRHRRFIIAHVGDCRAVLGTLGNDGTLHHVELSKDHKLEDEEAQRVLQTGAWIRPKMELPYFAPARVYASQVPAPATISTFCQHPMQRFKSSCAERSDAVTPPS